VSTTGSFLVGLYLDGAYLGSISCSRALASGESITLEGFTITLDSLNHVFSARADDTNLIDEADEDDNERSAMLTVDYPDLAITSLSYSLPGGRTTLSYGETVSATARVANLSTSTGLTFWVQQWYQGIAV
jgi:subtilase family serine protease